jgi:glutamate carboxypeptidase
VKGALEELRDRRGEMLDDLRRCVEIETPSRDKARCDAFVCFFTQLSVACGARVERIPNPNGGDNLILSWGSGDLPLVFIGHYDTVWPAGTLARKPFVIEDGVARGPGILDMKAGLVQALWAARLLHARTAQRPPPIIFVVNSDEEIGSPSSRAVIEQLARTARAVFVFEAPHHGAIKTARKGVGMYTVEVEGRAAHAGVEPEKGVNAVDELARVTLALHALNDYAVGTTVNVDMVSGGTARNTIAAFARAEIDVRVPTTAEARRIDEAMRSVRPHHPDAKIRISGELNRPPMERTPKIAELYERAKRVAAELGFSLDEVAVGGGSDGNFAAAVGAAVLDGLGAVGDGGHAEHEHIIVDSLAERTALAIGVAASLA